jgi:hypothetical protein
MARMQKLSKEQVAAIRQAEIRALNEASEKAASFCANTASRSSF